MTGSILDYMRAQDWVTRTVRNRSRALRDAGQDQGRTEAELAAGSGMTRRQVSDTLAAMARRPVGFDPVEHDVPDNADTESGAVVADLLGTAVRSLRSLPPQAQLATALTFYHGMSAKQAAEVLGADAAEVATWQQQAVLAVHQALLEAAGKDE